MSMRAYSMMQERRLVERRARIPASRCKVAKLFRYIYTSTSPKTAEISPLNILIPEHREQRQKRVSR